MSKRRRLLLIDDDKNFSEMAREYLDGEGLYVSVAHTRADGIKACSDGDVDVVLLDQKLPDGEGREICPDILKYNDRTKIIFTTAYPSFDNAIYAIKAGAYDYLSKPVGIEELGLAVERALRTKDLERIEDLHNFRNDQESNGTVLIGEHHGLAETSRLVEIAATSKFPVLITGETGVGKNVVAKCIHYGGASRKSAFISINCAALPESLIESELFGYEKGAFTGATASKKGIFEMADGGTLLLDEIGDMPVNLQSKLLSVIEDGKFKRLGGDTMKSVNVRIIAATNHDLGQSIRMKTFRSDLYYRLSVINIHVPPLRERMQDLPDLCEHLLGGMANRGHVALPAPELEKMSAYHWPGNVRELKSILERAVLLRDGNDIRPSVLLGLPNPTQVLPGPIAMDTSATPTLEEVETGYILQVLGKLNGNITRTADVLGMSLSTLKRKLKKNNSSSN